MRETVLNVLFFWPDRPLVSPSVCMS